MCIYMYVLNMHTYSYIHIYTYIYKYSNTRKFFFYSPNLSTCSTNLNITNKHKRYIRNSMSPKTSIRGKNDSADSFDTYDTYPGIYIYMYIYVYILYKYMYYVYMHVYVSSSMLPKSSIKGKNDSAYSFDAYDTYPGICIFVYIYSIYI
jgi:hypothetical protein